MRVLVVGSGGREHALCWALAGSPLLTQLWCAPGNAGIAETADCVAISALDIPALVDFARENQVDLVVVGPEAPLVAGLADAMAGAGIACFGPSKAAAQLEGSKTFTKEIADAAGIPTAAWQRFTDADAARAYVRTQGAPIVVKADGLAAGKGVVVAATLAEAEEAIADFMEAGTLGESGRSVVIEECLLGEEVSVFALCDGETALAMGAAQDHKRVGDGDQGPNTGGMGAYAPPPVLTPALAEEAMTRFIRPALAEMARRGMPFRGFLFAGLMHTASGLKLIEYNARFGDPECEVVLPLLASDLLAALLAACSGDLGTVELRWREAASIAVVMAARGYPATPLKGTEIRGLEQAEAIEGVRVFHAGTRRAGEQLLADGGRVLAVCATAATLREAQALAYRAVDAIDWPEGFCRHDIGWRALAREDIGQG
jgi:phosphoribosylamine--glycine ligase